MVTVKMDVAKLTRELKQVQPLLGKPMEELINQQTRLFISNPREGNGMIQTTPPSNEGAQGNAAKLQGEAAVARDILKVYATAPQIYLEMHAQNPNAAKGFYKAMLQGDYTTAREILASSGTRSRGIPIGSFDPSKHKASRGSRGRVFRHVPAQIVTDFKQLDKHIKKIKKNVGILASGLNAAASAVGGKVPEWVKRHRSRFSSCSIKEGRNGYTVRMVPRVGFDAAGTARRADYALRYRRNAIKRQIPYLIRAAAKKALKG